MAEESFSWERIFLIISSFNTPSTSSLTQLFDKSFCRCGAEVGYGNAHYYSNYLKVFILYVAGILFFLTHYHLTLPYHKAMDGGVLPLLYICKGCSHLTSWHADVEIEDGATFTSSTYEGMAGQ